MVMMLRKAMMLMMRTMLMQMMLTMLMLMIMKAMMVMMLMLIDGDNWLICVSGFEQALTCWALKT